MVVRLEQTDQRNTHSTHNNLVLTKEKNYLKRFLNKPTRKKNLEGFLSVQAMSFWGWRKSYKAKYFFINLNYVFLFCVFHYAWKE
jgi:hypothetical protein